MNAITAPIEKEVRAKESSVRQKAPRRGYRATKLREGNRNYLQYGPWMITDAYTNGVVAYGLDLDELEQWLAE